MNLPLSDAFAWWGTIICLDYAIKNEVKMRNDYPNADALYIRLDDRPCLTQ